MPNKCPNNEGKEYKNYVKNKSRKTNVVVTFTILILANYYNFTNFKEFHTFP